MGLLDNQTQFQYYNDSSNYGDYQFVSLLHVIDAFMYLYVGVDKVIPKVNRTDVQFHAMRALQELSYDVFKSVKSQEIEVPNTLTMALPQDYVNYVKLTVVGGDGIEKNIYPTSKTSNPFAIEQDADGNYVFYDSSPSTTDPTLNSHNTLMEQGTDTDPETPDYNYWDTTQNPTAVNEVNINDTFNSDTWNNYQTQTPLPNINASDSADVEIEFAGRRYGLDPQHAHMHGSFFIDYHRGFIHFSSALSGKTIVLKYISDGLGTDAEMVVHKFAEEAIYKWIAYGIMSTRSNVAEHVISRFKREKFAETRKAKIRLSNIKIEEFTQVLKGMSKQIK